MWALVVLQLVRTFGPNPIKCNSEQSDCTTIEHSGACNPQTSKIKTFLHNADTACECKVLARQYANPFSDLSCATFENDKSYNETQMQPAPWDFDATRATKCLLYQSCDPPSTCSFEPVWAACDPSKTTELVRVVTDVSNGCDCEILFESTLGATDWVYMPQCFALTTPLIGGGIFVDDNAKPCCAFYSQCTRAIADDILVNAREPSIMRTPMPQKTFANQDLTSARAPYTWVKGAVEFVYDETSGSGSSGSNSGSGDPDECTAKYVAKLEEEHWIQPNMKCPLDDHVTSDGSFITGISIPNPCGCYIYAKKFIPTAVSWDWSQHLGCRFWDSSCTFVPDSTFSAGILHLIPENCNSDCTPGEDLSFTECQSLSGFTTGTASGNSGCVVVGFGSHGRHDHVWFGSNDPPKFDPSTIIGTQFTVDGSIIEVTSAQKVCHQCPTTTATTQTSTTMTNIACSATKTSMLIDQGLALQHYDCQETPTQTLASSSLCECFEEAEIHKKSYSFDQTDHTCKLYDQCTITPKMTSFASNRNRFHCSHGCRDSSEPAVVYAQCNRGVVSVYVTTEATGCAATSDGTEIWLWPSPQSPTGATPGDTNAISSMRIGGNKLYRVCNGPCRRQVLASCGTNACSNAYDPITQEECQETAPEAYFAVEVSQNSVECQGVERCVQGTATVKSSGLQTKWQAFITCAAAATRTTKAAIEYVLGSNFDVGATFNKGCAACNALNQPVCSPFESVRSYAECDMVRRANNLPPPLTIRSDSNQPPGCFVETTSAGQNIFWGGQLKRYSVDLQSPSSNPRMCFRTDDTPQFKLVIQVKGQCAIATPQSLCPVTPSNTFYDQLQYEYAGCRNVGGQWGFFDTFVETPGDCSVANPCLCVEYFDVPDQCYKNVESCNVLAVHMGFLPPVSSAPGTGCKFSNGRLIPTNDSDKCESAPLPYMAVAPRDQSTQQMTDEQCRAIAASFQLPFVATGLLLGYCYVDSIGNTVKLTDETEGAGLKPLPAVEDCTFVASMQDCKARASNALVTAAPYTVISDTELPYGCVVDARNARLGATGVPVWNIADSSVRCLDNPKWWRCVCGYQAPSPICPPSPPPKSCDSTDTMAMRILVLVIAGLALILAFTTTVRTLPVLRGPALAKQSNAPPSYSASQTFL